MGLPVIVIRGILEGGKTTFLQDSLLRGMFGDVGRALILSQEEGEVEYDVESLKKGNVSLEVVSEANWNETYISNLVHDLRPQVIFIETNEMWGETASIYPKYFDIEQTICIVDGTTFNMYLTSMRQKINDMIKASDLVIINRCQPIPETSQMKRNVKMMNSNCTVMAVDENDQELKLETDLPFDVKAEVVNIKLEEFGIWYIDTFDMKDRYNGKIVEFDCMAVFSKKLPPRSFVAGRMAMTCCANDIQLIGHLCAFPKTVTIENKAWIHLKGRIHYMLLKGAKEEQVVIEYLDHKLIDAPKEEDQLVNLV